MRRRLALAVLAIVVAFGPVLVSPTPASAMPVVNVAITAPAAEGLRYESHSIFTLDLAARVVHVQVAITVTNQQPSYTSGGFINQFYFPRIGVPVLAEATNFAATRDTGTSLTVTPEDTDSPQIRIAAVTLQPALYYPQSQNIEFDYDLPAQPPRSQGLTRVNDAFSSFIAFGYGDPDITSVKIIVPSSLTTEIVGVDMARSQVGDQTVFTADSVPDPVTWTAAVDARNDAKLLQKEMTVEDQKLVIKGWPDDAEWATFVDEQLRNGLPALKHLIDQPWPEPSSTIAVIETAAPYLYGYAGWFDPLDNTIEIGDELEPIVILHELSHVWFNKAMFTDRWVNEALAEEFASRALEKIGQPLRSPDAVTPDAPGAFKLNDWGLPKLQESSSIEQEHFGYDASWTVLRGINDEVGAERLARVIDAASHNFIAYQGHPSPESSEKTNDWKRLLDLVDEVAGSKQADALFTQFVVDEKDALLLAQRAEARDDYRAFVDASGGWSAPLAIRLAMGKWEFGAATALMPDARDVLRTRDELAGVLRPLGRAVPPPLQQHYESQGGSDLRAVADEAKRDLDAAHHIVDADTAVHASHGIVGSFGLWFAGADDKVHRAERALENGDATAAIRLADSARSQANDATKAGVVRLVALLLVIATAYALWTRGRPFAVHALEERANKKRVADVMRPPWPEWAPPPPPYYPPSPPEMAPPDPSHGGPPAPPPDDP